MNIIETFLTNNPCYQAGQKIKPKGAFLHSIGCPQPNAMVFVKNWNKESYNRACVHAFIDGNTGEIYQTLPWDMRGWHSGSGSKGSGNNTHIGVEMCEPDCIEYVKGSFFSCTDVERASEVARRTYASAVELFAMLCKQFDWDPLEDGVILGHAEGHARGIASNHGDPEHMWEQLDLGYTMDTFRQDVKKTMKKEIAPTQSTTSKLYRVQTGAYSNKENADARYKAVKNAGFDVCMVKSGGLYKVQVGAYKIKENADRMLENIEKAGFDGYITTKGGEPVEVEKYTQEEFIRDIQCATGSKVDGIAGEETIENTITVSVFLNHKHPVVAPIQKWLKVLGYYDGAIDGIFGKKSAKAVERLQKDIGAMADGEITRMNKTWRFLLGML